MACWSLIRFKNHGAVIGQSRQSWGMVDGASKRRKSVYERLVPKHMINPKAIYGRAPSPFLPVAMLCTPQIGEASLRGEGLKKISAMKARAGSLNIEIISARIDVADHDKRHLRSPLGNLYAFLKVRDAYRGQKYAVDFRLSARCGDRLKPVIRQSLSDVLPREIVPPFRENNSSRAFSREPIGQASDSFAPAMANIERYDPKSHFSTYPPLGSRDLA
jgi:hypothetical protein